MGYESRYNAVATLEKKAREKARRESDAFASLKDLYDRAPHEAIAILSKLKHAERVKVMLHLGIIDEIQPTIPRMVHPRG